MTRAEFVELVKNEIVLLDGATGSNMQEKGMPTGVCPEKWILENPEPFVELQKAYVKAGTRILYAPTFTSNRVKLEEYGLENRIGEMNQGLMQLSKRAIEESKEELEESGCELKKVYIAGDLTMTGRQLYPAGDMLFEDLVDVYKEQISYLLMEDVDLFAIETMMSLNECRAAVLAVKETCDLPVMVTLTFEENNRTLYGTDPKVAATVLSNMGVDAIGVNCSTGPKKMCQIVKDMREYCNIPIIAKPNAGLPVLVGDKTVFNLNAQDFAEEMKDLIEAGADIVGGCCGTTPEHISKLFDVIKDKKPKINTSKKKRLLTTERTMLPLTLDGKFMVVGERINPTGKKAFQEELKQGNLSTVVQMAEEQVEQGADILDINMGMNGIDEKEMMLKAMYEVLDTCDIPLCIDSSHVSVIEAALREYPGRGLINSISYESEKVEKLLPIAKKYGAMFILLPLWDKGLPKDLEEKKDIIHKVIKEAEKVGLTKEDIIVDGLVNTVGANKEAAFQTLETIRYCREELDILTIIGLSNISFGLPERQFVNSAFLSMTILGGLTMAIGNPNSDLLMNTALAADLLKGKEEADVRYINRVTSKPVTISSDKNSNPVFNKEGQEKGARKALSEGNQSDIHPIFEAVVKGNKRTIVELVQSSLEEGNTPNYILDSLLIPAINHVGDLFDKQIYFLPQLISSANAMKLGVDYLEPLLQKIGGEKKGTIVIATVSGDVHDIGKNLVVLMLKNYGFYVIDLGKDVPSEKIIEIAKNENADIIALSALMTTTMLEMKEVIRLKTEAGLRAKVVIGGAVITESYAKEIGADGFAKDAKETVTVVNQLLQ